MAIREITLEPAPTERQPKYREIDLGVTPAIEEPRRMQIGAAPEPTGFLRKAFGYIAPPEPPLWERASPVEKIGFATRPISHILTRIGGKITSELGLRKPEEIQELYKEELVEDLQWYQKTPEAVGWTAEKIAEYKTLSAIFKLTGLSRILTATGQKFAHPFLAKELVTKGGLQTLKTLSKPGLKNLARKTLMSFLRAAPENTAFIASWSAADALKKGKSAKEIGQQAIKGAEWGLALTGAFSAIGNIAATPEIKAAGRNALTAIIRKYPRLVDVLARDIEPEYVEAARQYISRQKGVDARLIDITVRQRAALRNMARVAKAEVKKQVQKEAATQKYWTAGKKAKPPTEIAVITPTKPVEPITPTVPIPEAVSRLKTVDVMRQNVERYGMKGLQADYRRWLKSPEGLAEKEALGLPEGHKFIPLHLWETFNRSLLAKDLTLPEPTRPAVEEIPKKPPVLATPKQKAQAHIIARQKGLMSKRDKPTQSYRRFAKAMTGKTSMVKMTGEEAAHFVEMLDALTVDYKGVARIPTSKHLITKELADKIGKFKDIGVVERVRPAWRVFEKIGLTKEVFEPAFKAEISSMEEVFAFREEAKQMQKLVGRDKETSERLFTAIEKDRPVKLSDEEKKVAAWGKKHWDDWADRLRLTPEQRRKNYITHTFEREITQDFKERHLLDPDLARALDFITPKTIFNPFLQKRFGRKVGLKRDFWAALEAYENRAIKKFYYEPLIKRIRVYERFLPPSSARYLRSYIARITGRPLVIDREVNQTLKEVAKEIEKLPGGKELARYLSKGNASGMLAYNMTGIYYECWLGLRPASAIKNLSQHGLTLAETGAVAFTKALKTIGKERAELLPNSLVLRSRKLGYLPGIDQTFIKGLESKRRKISMAMFRAADRKNVSDSFIAGYWEAKRNGLPDDWAYKRGDEVAAKTQYIYSKLAGAQFMQTSPGRVLGVLTTWPANWTELMNDWIQAKPSRVYTDYAKATGKEMPKVNWIARRKSLWTYLSLVSLAMLIHKKTPFKALYYTGWTSIRSLTDIASGKLAGLEIPRIIGNLVAGIALGDKRRIKQSWNEAKRFVVIARELTDIISGKKDWINLFVYLESEKKKKYKRLGD